MARRDSVAPTIDGPRATETGEQGTNALARYYWNGGAAPASLQATDLLGPRFGGAFLWGHRPDIFRDEIEGGRVVFLQPCCPNWPRFGGAFSWVNKTAPMIAGLCRIVGACCVRGMAERRANEANGARARPRLRARKERRIAPPGSPHTDVARPWCLCLTRGLPSRTARSPETKTLVSALWMRGE